MSTNVTAKDMYNVPRPIIHIIMTYRPKFNMVKIKNTAYHSFSICFNEERNEFVKIAHRNQHIKVIRNISDPYLSVLVDTAKKISVINVTHGGTQANYVNVNIFEWMPSLKLKPLPRPLEPGQCVESLVDYKCVAHYHKYGTVTHARHKYKKAKMLINTTMKNCGKYLNIKRDEYPSLEYALHKVVRITVAPNIYSFVNSHNCFE